MCQTVENDVFDFWPRMHAMQCSVAYYGSDGASAHILPKTTFIIVQIQQDFWRGHEGVGWLPRFASDTGLS